MWFYTIIIPSILISTCRLFLSWLTNRGPPSSSCSPDLQLNLRTPHQHTSPCLSPRHRILRSHHSTRRLRCPTQHSMPTHHPRHLPNPAAMKRAEEAPRRTTRCHCNNQRPLTSQNTRPITKSNQHPSRRHQQSKRAGSQSS